MASESELVHAARGQGVNIDSVWDLVRLDEPYPTVIPLLMEALAQTDPIQRRFREGLVRALPSRKPDQMLPHFSSTRCVGNMTRALVLSSCGRMATP